MTVKESTMDIPEYDEASCERDETGKHADALRLVAYCGLYCGDCFWHAGRVMRLARELRREVRSSGFDDYAEYMARLPAGKVYQDFDACWRVLGAMTRFGCRKVCREGGCSPSCGIRVCCQKKRIDGCWQCDDLETCRLLNMLEPIHKGGHLRNLRALREKGPLDFGGGVRYWAGRVRKDKPPSREAIRKFRRLESE